MTQSQPIRGKVARLLNSREVALNIGSRDGVVEGMHFDILDPKGEDIIDPDTYEVIGSLNRPKVRVQVVTTQEKLSVARTFKRRQVNVGGQGASFSALSEFQRYLLPERWVTVYETLKTDEKTWEDLDETESFVKVGDPVVQVLSAPVEEPENQSGTPGLVAKPSLQRTPPD